MTRKINLVRSVEDFEITYGPWREVFLFFPKKTITGRYTIGWSLFRIAENIVGATNIAGRAVAVISDESVQYASNKKEIFTVELTGKGNKDV